MSPIAQFGYDHPAMLAFFIFVIAIGAVMLLIGGVRGLIAQWRAAGAVLADPAGLAPLAFGREDEARWARIVRDNADWAAATGSKRAIVVDPLTDDVLAHVAPGAGSMASVAAEVGDTKLRSAAEAAEVRAAEAEAYAQAQAEEARLAQAWSSGMWAELDAKLWKIAPWLFYAHDDEGAHCPRCAAAIEHVSGEFAALVERVESETTGEISRRDIEALLAAA